MSLHRGDLLLPRCQHLVERISTDGRLNAVHPFIFLLDGGSGDAVEGVISFHDPSVRLGLTRFDHLVLIVRDEELKAVRLLVLHFTDAEVFQGDDASWFFISSVLKVVKAVICENEPPSFPGFDASP